MPTLVHYPSGGFGHYINYIIHECFLGHKQPMEFSANGNSHSYPSWRWLHYGELEDKDEPVLLVDSGIDNDDITPALAKFPDAPIIRMCIDDRSKSIVFQTCRHKAQGLDFFFSGESWEIREQYTLVYHYADNNPDFYLNNFKPIPNVININISDLFFNFHKVIDQLETVFGRCDITKTLQIHNSFLEANRKYAMAQRLVDKVQHALNENILTPLDEYPLHDQGYLIYWLEKVYNINEIPPYDYRRWFKNTDEVKECLKSTH